METKRIIGIIITSITVMIMLVFFYLKANAYDIAFTIQSDIIFIINLFVMVLGVYLIESKSKCILKEPHDPMPVINLRNSIGNKNLTKAQHKKILDDYKKHIGKIVV